MKIKRLLIGLSVVVAFVIVGCATNSTVSENSLGLRKTNIYTEKDTTLNKVEYSKKAPGEAKVIERSFENAPPLIPHSVDGLLPITKNNNSCVSCHTPSIAKSVGATAIPPSHFVSLRPTTKLDKDGVERKNGSLFVNTSDIKTKIHKLDELNKIRFNCSQCHVPQANVKPLVKNNFVPVFTSKDGKHKSNLLDVINEGVE